MTTLNDARIYPKLPPVAGPSLIAAPALLLALAAAPITDSELRVELDRLVPAVVAARGLPFRGALPARAMTRSGMQAAIEASVGAGAAEPSVGREAAILRRLGVVSTATDYGALLVQSYAPVTTPAPFYDIAARRLLVPDFLPLADQRLLLAHEIAHALADQRFGLRRALGLAADGRRLLDGDAQRARAALIEGDATLAALSTIDPRETFLGPSALGTLLERMRVAPTPGLPPWLAALSRFVHIDGFRFTARVRARQPWSAVDALWADPPASSEQLLHPESYDACDEPVAIPVDTFPALPGLGPPKESDVLGELVVRTWLTGAVSPELAARAAAGWGGDRAVLYAPPRATTAQAGAADGGTPGGDTEEARPLLWLTVWDDPADAADFIQAAAPALARLVHVRLPDNLAPDRIVLATGQETTSALVRRGNRVALLLGVPAAALGAAEAIVDPDARRPRGGRPRRAAPAGCPRRDPAAAPR
jgi:hypothetical protein